jgi:hypothetical protein
MASPACCAAGQPMQYEYTKQGDFVDVDGIKTYVTGDSPRLILVATDIFGFDFNQVSVSRRMPGVDVWSM